jgi:hypothetical protein
MGEEKIAVICLHIGFIAQHYEYFVLNSASRANIFGLVMARMR